MIALSYLLLPVGAADRRRLGLGPARAAQPAARRRPPSRGPRAHRRSGAERRTRRHRCAARRLRRARRRRAADLATPCGSRAVEAFPFALPVRAPYVTSTGASSAASADRPARIGRRDRGLGRCGPDEPARRRRPRRVRGEIERLHARPAAPTLGNDPVRIGAVGALIAAAKRARAVTPSRYRHRPPRSRRQGRPASPPGELLGAASALPGRLQRNARGRDPPRSPPRPPSAGAGGLRLPQGQGRRRRGRERIAAVRDGGGPGGAAPHRCQRRLEPRARPTSGSALEALDLELAEQPCATSPSSPRCARDRRAGGRRRKRRRPRGGARRRGAGRLRRRDG